MIIKNLKIQNFKSYGNNVSNINIDPTKGELILLHGQNGAGKSSLLESIDFALYGKVRGKKKKYVTSDALPNRFNGDLRVELEFETSNNHIKIVRTSTKLQLTIDGVPYERAGKANAQAKIEEIVGIDIDTFKSFISMSINDFKNFMVLTPEEKRLLLDRLFNLEIINQIGKLLKDKKKHNKIQEEIFLKEIFTYQSNLKSLSNSIEKIKESSKQSLEAEREQIIQLMLSKKSEFDDVLKQLEILSQKEKSYISEISIIQEKINELNFEIKTKRNKINLIDLKKCPTCETDLCTDQHLAYKAELINVLNSIIKLRDELSNDLSELQDRHIKINQVHKTTQQTYGELRSYLTQHKLRKSELDNKINSIQEMESINEIISLAEKINIQKKESENGLSTIKHKTDIITQLDKLFSDEGIKKSVIAKIVNPINTYIKENLEKIGMPFQVSLDDQFSANITLLGQEIEPDSLSTGETKKVNIAIMLAYLKLIRMKKHINLLFLDEVFASIDIQGIYEILDLLKDFAREYNINTFLIHHALLEKSSFDRVLKIEKNITSQIIEE